MQLQTQRLIMRDYKHDDFTAVFALDNHPELREMLGQDKLFTQQEFLPWFLGNIAAQTHEPRTLFQFLLEHRETGAFIGRCRLHIKPFNRVTEDTREANHLAARELSGHQSAGMSSRAAAGRRSRLSLHDKSEDRHICEIGYRIHPHYWRQGYATEAACELLRFGFVDLHLQSITAGCHAKNSASARVLQQIGMRYTGRVPCEQLVPGSWEDTLLFAIDRQEWQTQQAMILHPSDEFGE